MRIETNTNALALAYKLLLGNNNPPFDTTGLSFVDISETEAQALVSAFLAYRESMFRQCWIEIRSNWPSQSEALSMLTIEPTIVQIASLFLGSAELSKINKSVFVDSLANKLIETV